MRRELAERLLTQIMGWSDEEKTEERAYLEAFADYKYDEYQQYSPGLRFLESLGIWLRQFNTKIDRRIAYTFIKNRIIFISEAEMTHLVQLAFPLYIRPHLIEKTATQTGLKPFQVKKIIDTKQYRVGLRETLFLGLSDGARTDRFRRANPQDISNEQIWHAYDLSNAKAQNMQSKINNHLENRAGTSGTDGDHKFSTVVLLDDFTASGTSYIRKENDKWVGKIAKVINVLDSNENVGSLVTSDDLKIIIVIYVASPQAVEYINTELAKLEFDKCTIEFKVVLELDKEIKLCNKKDAEILSLLSNDAYFDADADDEHAKVAGDTFRYGYADCRLPVVLAHNTPNNSIYLMWAEDISTVHGLFPRVSRHRTFE